MQWDKPGGKVVISWVLIYPVATHRPCGHVFAPKNESGTTSQMISHDYNSNINNATSTHN